MGNDSNADWECRGRRWKHRPHLVLAEVLIYRATRSTVGRLFFSLRRTALEGFEGFYVLLRRGAAG
jgi:hypothetical protein